MGTAMYTQETRLQVLLLSNSAGQCLDNFPPGSEPLGGESLLLFTSPNIGLSQQAGAAASYKSAWSKT